MKKLAVVGGRDFDDYSLLEKAILNLLWYDRITEIVSGGAIGADSLALLFAKTNNLKMTEFLPDWDKYGKSAGFKRNKQIVDYSDFVIAFWNKYSKGTEHTIKYTKQSNKECIIFYY